jgi:hypothetical protein
VAITGFAVITLMGRAAVGQPAGLIPRSEQLPAHHAVPPPPVFFPSPLPTIPPPSRNAPEEPLLRFTVGSAPFEAEVREDGSIEFADHHGGLWAGADPIVGLAAILSLDAGDEAMRAARTDPYLPQKLRILEETREERWVLRRAHDERVMQRALDDLPRYLDAVWSERRWSAADRRRLLFALWDEAAEEGNQLLRAGGAEARRIIEEFVAYRLPPGSRHAFHAGELARLNRLRSSRQAFAPYRPRPGAEPDDSALALNSASPIARALHFF